jgi:hypothetical protein
MVPMLSMKLSKLIFANHAQVKMTETCKTCKRQFASPMALKVHITKKCGKQKIIWRCADCNRTLSSKQALQRHITTHTTTYTASASEPSKIYRHDIIDNRQVVTKNVECITTVQTADNNVEGFVYCLHSDCFADSLYKVGVTRTLERRLGAHVSSLPGAAIIATIPSLPNPKMPYKHKENEPKPISFAHMREKVVHILLSEHLVRGWRCKEFFKVELASIKDVFIRVGNMTLQDLQRVITTKKEDNARNKRSKQKLDVSQASIEPCK